MASVTITIADAEGGAWTADLGPEVYALLLAASQRDAPEGRPTPAEAAAAALERALLRGVGVGARTGQQAPADVDVGRMRGQARGASSGTSPAQRWQVRGVLACYVSSLRAEVTAVVDMTVAAPDWHAAELEAVDRMREAFGLPEGAPFGYTWSSGPDVTPLNAAGQPDAT